MKFYRTTLKDGKDRNGEDVKLPRCDKKYYVIHGCPDYAVISAHETPGNEDAVDIETLEESEKQCLREVVRTHFDWWRAHPDCAPRGEEVNP